MNKQTYRIRFQKKNPPHQTYQGVMMWDGLSDLTSVLTDDGENVYYSTLDRVIWKEPWDPDCQAVKERMELTKRIQHACAPGPGSVEVCPADGSEYALAIWGSILHGIIREYCNGGDQMVENCTCGLHTDPPQPESLAADHEVRPDGPETDEGGLIGQQPY